MSYPLPEHEKVKVQNWNDVINSIKTEVLIKQIMPPYFPEDEKLPDFERGITMAVRHIEFLVHCICGS